MLQLNRFLDPARRWELAFPAILTGIVVLLSVLRINGSSIGMYNWIFYGAHAQDPNLLFGQARAIRADEWRVVTPWTVAQARDGFALNNDLYVAGQSLVLSDVPVRSWVAFFEPQHWAFFFLPLEQAFAFKWWFKALMLAIAIYVLALMLTGRNILVSAMAALSFVFAPFIQWWFATYATDVTSFGVLTFVCFVFLVKSIPRPLPSLLSALLLIYFAACFAFTIYPPYQVSLAMFLFLVGAGYVASQWKYLGKRGLRILAAALSLCGLLIGALLVAYYISNKAPLMALAGTVYPGIRHSVSGGGLGLFKAMAGFYNIQLLNDALPVPPPWRNQSEAASFFFFSLFLLPFYAFFLVRSIRRHEPVDLPLVVSICALGLLLIWGTLGLPAILARLLLLSFVDGRRLLLTLGVANHLLIIYFLCRFKVEQTPTYRKIALVYALLVFAVVLVMGFVIKANWPGYLGSRGEIVLISLVAGTLMALLLYQRQLLFMGLFLGFSLASAVAVNPLYRGLSPLTSGPLATAVARLHDRDSQGVWVVYDNVLFADYLASQGVQVLNGTYYYPNLKFWSRFDPGHRYAGIYNRYEHIEFVPAGDQNAIEFVLLFGDWIQIGVSPCNPLLGQLRVQYYVFTSPAETVSCLSLAKKVEYPNLTLYIYQRGD